MLRYLFYLPSFSFSCLFALGCSGQTPPAAQPVAHIEPEKESSKPLTVELGGEMKMEFVLIPKGKFRMGSPADERGHNCGGGRNPFIGPESLHEVEITRAFYLGVYPVTQEQFTAVMRDEQRPFFVKGMNLPAVGQGWRGASDFCKKMRDNDKQKRQFRLPTEAEWEYACRAGSKTPYYFGEDPNKLGEYAWFKDNANGRPHPVGEKKPNAWGLFDMHGNVAQWCEDYYGPYEGLDAKDPVRSVGPLHGTPVERHDESILRGGSWEDDAEHCRGACRGVSEHGSVGDTTYGFRVAFCPD
ncbi:MAG TPA: formylglycine-generating enzyme family protein [Gemmata sp.]|jgi:formylglycine-generating enzyme required for sulfatase activity|nr:formylglycine-generating enzyme family protein [Gemmata sp.]